MDGESEGVLNDVLVGLIDLDAAPWTARAPQGVYGAPSRWLPRGRSKAACRGNPSSFVQQDRSGTRVVPKSTTAQPRFSPYGEKTTEDPDSETEVRDGGGPKESIAWSVRGQAGWMDGAEVQSTGTLYPTRGPAPKRKGETYRGDGSERSEGPTVTRKRTGVRDVPGTGPGTVGTMGTTTQRACFKAARLEKGRRQGNENQDVASTVLPEGISGRPGPYFVRALSAEWLMPCASGSWFGWHTPQVAANPNDSANKQPPQGRAKTAQLHA
ncbi:hypothetical protein MGG_16633 [Pyricularia oryzae 70-15]|uniref:Uncharacterized protein n=1 Tax=Pyricularia oryzae (strain 70-15 / ATCC MYA-4617 / FGSC 8958) TaxID=242507 RepID=G4N0U2_PYRO7|nr:uncharacterized protein MGG_16633 [Pyricularia oryzae 70-15]EHA51525.1 hypothetical protein MGG_16633 [Pyricularia oryzae 70-15]